VPNSKNQIGDSGEDMDMSYIRLTKKKEWRMVEVPILENQMKQPKPKNELNAKGNTSNFPNAVGWYTF
jgi:hypothetical protein